MLPEYFAIVGSVVASSGALYYLYCTIKGTVKPNKITWFFWGAFPMIAFAAQFSQDVGLVLWVTFAAGAPPFLVLIASFINPLSYWKIQPVDYAFAAVAVIAIFFWWLTKNANVALTFALLADLAVAIPTLLKAIKFPETESRTAFAIGALGFGIGILSIQVWTYENYAFVIYLFLLNLSIAILASRRSVQPAL